MAKQYMITPMEIIENDSEGTAIAMTHKTEIVTCDIRGARNIARNMMKEDENIEYVKIHVHTLADIIQKPFKLNKPHSRRFV